MIDLSQIRKTGLAILMVSTVAACYFLGHFFYQPGLSDVSGEKSPSVSQEVQPLRQTPAQTGVYQTGAIEGHLANDLYADFIGYKGRIPSEITVNWAKQLETLWDRKVDRRGSNAVVSQTRDLVVPEYARYDPGQMSLVEYQQNAARQADAIYENLDWTAVGKSYFKGDKRKLALLREAAKTVGGRSIVAYAMTELLPSRNNGAYNRDYLDFLLQHAGRRYVESLPALHDNITSFGPYQFTQFAVYDANGGPRGASRMNRFLPKGQKIPGSTMMLRNDDHVKAAYLFGLDNLATLIRGLNKSQLRTFERVAPNKGLDIVQFIAVAHNKPAYAMPSARRWLDNGARTSFMESCPRVSQVYAMKTVANFRALSPTPKG